MNTDQLLAFLTRPPSKYEIVLQEIDEYFEEEEHPSLLIEESRNHHVRKVRTNKHMQAAELAKYLIQNPLPVVDERSRKKQARIQKEATQIIRKAEQVQGKAYRNRPKKTKAGGLRKQASFSRNPDYGNVSGEKEYGRLRSMLPAYVSPE